MNDKTTNWAQEIVKKLVKFNKYEYVYLPLVKLCSPPLDFLSCLIKSKL